MAKPTYIIAEIASAHEGSIELLNKNPPYIFNNTKNFLEMEFHLLKWVEMLELHLIF